MLKSCDKIHIEGYELAIEQGADFIECDLALTKDGVLVCLHDAYLSSVTNVASIEDFADRKVPFYSQIYNQTFI